jgi:hypothetical protein
MEKLEFNLYCSEDSRNKATSILESFDDIEILFLEFEGPQEKLSGINFEDLIYFRQCVVSKMRVYSLQVQELQRLIIRTGNPWNMRKDICYHTQEEKNKRMLLEGWQTLHTMAEKQLESTKANWVKNDDMDIFHSNLLRYPEEFNPRDFETLSTAQLQDLVIVLKQQRDSFNLQNFKYHVLLREAKAMHSRQVEPWSEARIALLQLLICNTTGQIEQWKKFLSTTLYYLNMKDVAASKRESYLQKKNKLIAEIFDENQEPSARPQPDTLRILKTRHLALFARRVCQRLEYLKEMIEIFLPPEQDNNHSTGVTEPEDVAELRAHFSNFEYYMRLMSSIQPSGNAICATAVV